MELRMSALGTITFYAFGLRRAVEAKQGAESKRPRPEDASPRFQPQDGPAGRKFVGLVALRLTRNCRKQAITRFDCPFNERYRDLTPTVEELAYS
jgi:hypothetical protein